MATLGVVLPSFVIILLVASLFTRLMKYAGVKAVLGGIKPAIVALIFGTAITMLLSLVLGFKSIDSIPQIDLKAVAVLAVMAMLSFFFKKWKKKPISPSLLIIVSGVLGVLLY